MINDKQIINGIDVSEWELKGVLIPITECKYFEGIGDCKESKGLCVDNDNCYFKQFKRLQQELDIKEKMLDKFMIGSGETLEKLQKENEKLKDRLHFKNLYKLSGKCFFDEARQCNYFDDFVKARQALEEIRDYASVLYSEPLIDGSKLRLRSGMYRIKSKINEVLNDRD